MRAPAAAMTVTLLCGCGPGDVVVDDAPTEWSFWSAGGAFVVSLEMVRDQDDRIELRDHGQAVASGSLTEAGLAAWDVAIASVDPNAVDDLPVCAPVDGVDACIDMEPRNLSLGLCYCVDPLPPAVAELDAFFSGLARALAECESSPHIVVDRCP